MPACAEQRLETGTWFSLGLHGASDPTAGQAYRCCPFGWSLQAASVIDWSNRDVHRYLKQHDLAYHPLWKRAVFRLGTCIQAGRLLGIVNRRPFSLD